jgi:hypothetical protein
MIIKNNEFNKNNKLNNTVHSTVNSTLLLKDDDYNAKKFNEKSEIVENNLFENEAKFESLNIEDISNINEKKIENDINDSDHANINKKIELGLKNKNKVLNDENEIKINKDEEQEVKKNEKKIKKEDEKNKTLIFDDNNFIFDRPTRSFFLFCLF